MSKYGFDLDGTLDKPGLVQLANDLIDAGHEVHIISASFPNSDWTSRTEKLLKIERLGVRYTELHVLEANLNVPTEVWIQRDLGLRKGHLVEKLGLLMMIDDSSDYIDAMKKCCGAVLLQVK